MSQTITETKAQEINRTEITTTSEVVCECPGECCYCCCCIVCCINPLIWWCGYKFDGDENECIFRCFKRR